MYKLFFIACLFAYAASIPLNDNNKSPPKDESKDHQFVSIKFDEIDAHRLIKRSDHTGAGKAFAEKKRNDQNHQKPKSLTKRETEQKSDTEHGKNEGKTHHDLSKEEPPKDRKIRDTSKEEEKPKNDQKHCVVVVHDNANEEKPKRETHNISELPPTDQQSQPKTFPIHKRDTGKENKKKHIDADDDDSDSDDDSDQTKQKSHSTESTKDKVPPVQKSKREANESKPDL